MIFNLTNDTRDIQTECTLHINASFKCDLNTNNVNYAIFYHWYV